MDAHRRLLSLPLTGSRRNRVGLSVADLRLIVLHLPTIRSLDSKPDTEAGAWVDAALRAAGLAPASDVTLPPSFPIMQS
jgi:hypothetical protein